MTEFDLKVTEDEHGQRLVNGKTEGQWARIEREGRRRLKVNNARENLLDFITYTMPDPSNDDDPDASQFNVQAYHRVFAEALERVERGECLRLAISVPPQHGKSETASRRFPAWFVGRNPHKNIMFGTYSDSFAQEFGAEVRDIIDSPRFRDVFPKVGMRAGSKAKDFMRVEVDDRAAGRLAFIGRGGAGTGKPADLFIIDDPLKNAEEADSPTIIRQLHDWFSKVAFTRCHVGSAIIIIHTRWVEDDLIGRLCDPDHPHHDPDIAEKWTYINIPSVVSEGPLADAMGIEPEAQIDPAVVSQFGEKPIAALWPERFPLRHLAEAKKMNQRGFEALYQGRPAPEDGEYFTRDMLVEHRDASEYPKNLRKYGASDHALTEKEYNDPNCLGAFGLDENDEIWIMPDLVWDRFRTDVLVEEMLSVMRTHKPLAWFAEDEHIKKSIEPFLLKRMSEERVYTVIEGMPSTKDLKARARPIQGRMAMKKVHFPAWMPWWERAKSELLKFPSGVHDDFVSFMSLIGRGMADEIGASPAAPRNDNVVPVGSIAWVKAQDRARRKHAAKMKASAGF